MLATALASAALVPVKPATGQLLNPGRPAQGFVVSDVEFPTSQKHAMKAPSRAEGETLSMNYSPAGQPYKAMAFENQKAGLKVALAFQLTTATANKFAGNDISSVLFYTPINRSTRVNDVANATVFIAADATGQPGTRLVEKTVELPTTGLTFFQADLDTPYPIEAGKKVFVGVEFTLASANDVWLVYDYLDHGSDDCGGWVGNSNSTSWAWQNIAQNFGFVCVGATITGTNLPTNQVAVNGVYTNPAEEQNKQFEFEFEIENEAADVVKNIELKYTIGSLEPVVETMTLPNDGLGYNTSLSGTISQLTYPTPSLDGIDITVEVTKVNGQPNKSSYAKAAAKLTIIPEGKGYRRNAVIEEFTSTKCGYCPQGIVTMEYIRENYPDGGLIPVAVHGNNMGTDPMTAQSFSQVENNFANGYPSAIMNRQYRVFPYPASSVINLYNALSEVPALASVEATANIDPENENRLVFHTTTQFSFDYTDAADRYTLAFAITEDNVGPYLQHNYFAGEDVDMHGWQNMDEDASTIYNDVARQYATNRGITGSIPATVVAGEKYDFEYKMNMVSAIKDTDNIHGVVYIINKATGVVENVTSVKKVGGTSGIEDIDAAANNAPVEYYNLQGVRVANPANGLYIRRQGSTATKVLIR